MSVAWATDEVMGARRTEDIGCQRSRGFHAYVMNSGAVLVCRLTGLNSLVRNAWRLFIYLADYRTLHLYGRYNGRSGHIVQAGKLYSGYMEKGEGKMVGKETKKGEQRGKLDMIDGDQNVLHMHNDKESVPNGPDLR